MYCTKCGCQVLDDALFCTKCGNSLQENNVKNSDFGTSESTKQQCQLIITREKQFFVVNPAVKIIVDHNLNYAIKSGATISIPVTVGKHKIEFSCGIRNKIIDIEIFDSAKLTIKFNRVTGSIEVR